MSAALRMLRRRFVSLSPCLGKSMGSYVGQQVGFDCSLSARRMLTSGEEAS